MDVKRIVPLTEQYRLAERMADYLLAEPDHDSFAARVLESTPDDLRIPHDPLPVIEPFR